jgi:hypothetical protein
MTPGMRDKIFLGACAAAGMALVLVVLNWAHIRNEWFVLTGARDESGGYYGFNSGSAGAFYMSLVPAGLVLYWHHTCQHSPWCLRYGKYAVAGGVGKKCHRHHPDLRDHPRAKRGEILDLLHAEWKKAGHGKAA